MIKTVANVYYNNSYRVSGYLSDIHFPQIRVNLQILGQTPTVMKIAGTGATEGKNHTQIFVLTVT